VTTVNPRERPKATNLNTAAINPIIPLVPSSNVIINNQRSGQPSTIQQLNNNKISVSIKPPPANQAAFSPTLNQQQHTTSLGFDDDFNSLNSTSLNNNNDLQFVNQLQPPQLNQKMHQLLTSSNSSPIQTSNFNQFSSNERINQQQQMPFNYQQTPVITNAIDKKSHRRSASQ
jgi:hypothetical protein